MKKATASIADPPQPRTGWFTRNSMDKPFFSTFRCGKKYGHNRQQ